MEVFREINNKVFVFVLYTPIVHLPKSIFVESNSKTTAISRMFEKYNISPDTINSIRGFYFNENLEMKEMDLKAAFNRRIV